LKTTVDDLAKSCLSFFAIKVCK